MVKIHEELKIGVAVPAADYRSAGSLFNGAASASNTFIDASGYDTITFLANVGVVQAGNTLDARILESDDDDPAAATAITGAAFSAIGSTTDSTIRYASLDCVHQKKYLWVETFKTGTGSCNIGIEYLLKGGIQPVMAAPDFDIDGAPSV